MSSTRTAGETKPKVLLIGWDGADWKVLNQLIDRGEMPNLTKLIESGVMGNLTSSRPMLSPMLWTTIATGQYPDRHGIFGFTEPKADGSGVQLVTSTSVKTPTIWQLCEANGFNSAVVGWFATHPADHLPGIVISDMYANDSGRGFDDWPLPARSVSPASSRDIFADLRLHHSEVGMAQLAPFIPGIDEGPAVPNERSDALTRFLARATSIHGAATYIAEHEPWNLLGVYFETIDRLSHWFMEYRPPRLDWVSAEEVALYGGVVDQIYRFHDYKLGRYLQLVDEDTTIVICSDHGFHSDHLRPATSASMQKGNPLLWHRPQGIFVASGPGIKKDEIIYGATIRDIAPTVMELLGLAPTPEMDGRALSQIYESPPSPGTLKVPTSVEIQMDSHEVVADTWAAEDTLAQLIKLGYLEPPGKDAQESIALSQFSRAMNLADVYIEKQDHQAAKLELLKALKLRPGDVLARRELASCYLKLDDTEAARALLEPLLKEGGERPWIRVMQAELALKDGDHELALKLFRDIDTPGMQGHAIQVKVGRILSEKQLWDEALEAYEKALEFDEDSPDAHSGLGFVLLQRQRYQESIEHFLVSIGLNYYQPLTHVQLGIALAATGRLRNASEAFRNALSMQPENELARSALEQLSDKVEPQTAEENRQALLASAAQTPPRKAEPPSTKWQSKCAERKTVSPEFDMQRDIIIVSGLPRSGTSMMMQMLGATNIAMASDDVRQPDKHNPRGYFEYQPVSKRVDAEQWLDQCAGKTVKVVAPLLPGLPRNRRYAVLFLHRDMTQVVESQKLMTDPEQWREQLHRIELDLYEEKYAGLISNFELEVQRVQDFLASHDCFDVLDIDYEAVLDGTSAEVERIAHFLRAPLDTDRMAAAVEQSLNHHRGSTDQA